ncbi:hypothetical protein FIU91_12670 [Roseivivax sp. THAF30]|nr:hypothetical protein FIU91_12670 [Roseivivax sp. THAF30]
MIVSGGQLSKEEFVEAVGDILGETAGERDLDVDYQGYKFVTWDGTTHSIEKEIDSNNRVGYKIVRRMTTGIVAPRL